jgi:predicted nucleic acid-binding Zn ribbon protein
MPTEPVSYRCPNFACGYRFDIYARQPPLTECPKCGRKFTTGDPAKRVGTIGPGR